MNQRFAGLLTMPRPLSTRLATRLAAVAVVLAHLCCALAAASAIEPYEFANELEQTRFQALTRELRCTVCQNQSLADSDAPLAQDLRREVFAMLRAGQTDGEIRQFMVDRYGQFVLYRPPMAGHTVLLWGGPVLLLAGSLLAAILVIRRRRKLLP